MVSNVPLWQTKGSGGLPIIFGVPLMQDQQRLRAPRAWLSLSLPKIRSTVQLQKEICPKRKMGSTGVTILYVQEVLAHFIR